MSSSLAPTPSTLFYSQKQVCHFAENCIVLPCNQAGSKRRKRQREKAERVVLDIVYSPIDLLWENAIALHEEQTTGAKTHTHAHNQCVHKPKLAISHTHTHLILSQPNTEIPQHEYYSAHLAHWFKSTCSLLHKKKCK